MAWVPKRNVVVPVDFSDESFAAIDVALELVESPGAVHVVHVLPELAATDPGVIWETVDDRGRRKHAEEAIRERLADPRYQGVDVAVAFGDPAEQVAEFSRSLQAELVVLPSHGRTGLSRWLIGSVAERVVRLCHCPVLVLRD